MPSDLSDALAQDRAAVEARLEQALHLGDCPARLIDATRHALLGGGKRMRAILVLESARLCGAPDGAALDLAAAVEAIHAYSLVHDDLPDMDDDDLRRGKPTVHKAFDPATAILVGDGLQALGFELIAEADAPADRLLALSVGMARAAGLWGMVGGQMRDIAAERGEASETLDDIARIQRMKTGALIEWSATAGAILAGADPAPLAAYSSALGLAFQLRDDLLDLEGSAEAVGKAVGKDAGANKATFVRLLGADATRARALELRDEAIRALEPYGQKGHILSQLAEFTVTRSH